jgi:hypothetical protein
LVVLEFNRVDPLFSTDSTSGLVAAKANPTELSKSLALTDRNAGSDASEIGIPRDYDRGQFIAELGDDRIRRSCREEIAYEAHVMSSFAKEARYRLRNILIDEEKH